MAIAILTFLNSTTKDCCFTVFSRHFRRIKILVADRSANQRKDIQQDSSMKRKQSNAQRDHCTICYGNGTGSSGHSAQFCAFKNGPYEGRFRDAAIASQASRQQAKKARQQRSNQQGGSSSSGGAPPELSAFLADRLDTPRDPVCRGKSEIESWFRIFLVPVLIQPIQTPLFQPAFYR